MNKKLEQELNKYFLAWREEMQRIEDLFVKGCLTYQEYLAQQESNRLQCANNFFTEIHQNSDW